MGDIQSVIPSYEGEQHMIAAAQHILKALGASKNLTDEFRKILVDAETHLSAMSTPSENRGGEFSEAEEQLKSAEEKIMSWKSNQSMIWNSGPVQASEYLQAVEVILRLMESLGNLSTKENEKQDELFQRAHSVLQTAMTRLEEELIHMLVQSKLPFEPEYTSFRSFREGVLYDESFVSVEDESMEETSRRDRSVNEFEEYVLDLVLPRVIPDARSIANVMFASNYGHEFCQAFISARKAALDAYLVDLEMENYSIEDVMKMEWDCLNCKIRKWVRAMKIIFRAYLASEKRLCDQILGEFGSVNSICFVEISKAVMTCLLNFGEALLIGPHGPEKLFRLLDMYEGLADLLLNIDALFIEQAGSFVRMDFHELLRRLGFSVRVSFVEFWNAVESNTSTNPFPGGGVHHLTRYVMNYIKTLTAYCDTLNSILEDQTADDSDPVAQRENEQGVSSPAFCPVARHLQSVISALETNLENKSNLYKNASLQHIFLMNNIHYMVQKVMNSQLRLYFGDEWIRKHIGKFQQHATGHERETWSPVLSLLKDNGCLSLKERCRRFSIAFEEVYKSQTGWSIPDPQLREDLRISTSQNVIHAYRTFIGRNSTHMKDKYIKYPADELEKYILDLYEGSPRSLHSFLRR